MNRLLSTLVLLCILCGCTAHPISTIPTDTTTPTVTAIPQTTATTATVPPTTPPEATVTTEPPAADPLELLLDRLTTEQLVGQLFLARCPDSQALEDIRTYHLGGYILFGQDFVGQTPETVRQTITDYQATSVVPMLIAVDEEGGTVTRVSGNAAFREEPFPSPRDLYAQGGMELLAKTETEKCKLLRYLGINVNMAPVCDITTDPAAFMYNRSLGLEPAACAAAVSSLVCTMNEAQVGSVLKHFPGYGNNDDTHIGNALDERSLEELEQRDLLPFQAGIDAGCGAILISHTVVNVLDPEHPASLSSDVIQYLRKEMNYSGVIVTDDLVMDAITDVYGTSESAVMAVLAGNDLLCTSDYQAQYNAVLQAVRDGRISTEQIRASALRILRWKKDLGILG